ncbi:hypothetical protein THOG05_320031 [Vibrio rotiferianus]|nr:hypothetical protein THOG05_320031 [Vibrio rotiferianus]
MVALSLIFIRLGFDVNAYHSRAKEWMNQFHGVATKYLDHYLG